MSTASRLGYAGERPIELLLRDRPDGGQRYPVSRPRAGAVADVGDLIGLPVVISAKNHARMDLAGWTADLPRMVEAAGLATGVVWHKRRGVADPRGWYVTTTGDLFLPLLDTYARARGAAYAGL